MGQEFPSRFALAMKILAYSLISLHKRKKNKKVDYESFYGIFGLGIVRWYKYFIVEDIWSSKFNP